MMNQWGDYGVTEPLTAVAIGATVFGEPLTMPIIEGIGLVILSVVTVIAGPHFVHKRVLPEAANAMPGRHPRGWLKRFLQQKGRLPV